MWGILRYLDSVEPSNENTGLGVLGAQWRVFLDLGHPEAFTGMGGRSLE